MSPLQTSKLIIVDQLGIAKDALHVYVGLTLFLTSAALLRWPLSSWRPWLVALAGALAGEAWDLRDSLVYDSPIRLAANLKDVINTIIWPTVLMLLARHTAMLRRH
ncbi:hypothetical protein [Sphingomonas lutea]|uniref:hypothetical protein n=1 Tax=Sphingomonas lutea TaxID=1045317 RepID=UPI001CB73D76|nr:hypothetical protein [Sphingomonas lutea]